jgi:EamA domain-containing membrane protein RarD
MSEQPQVRSRIGLMALAWLWVGLPFAYGVYELVRKVVQLFGG